nr:A24 family peptidase [uncultured Faecalibacillus sp.]
MILFLILVILIIGTYTDLKYGIIPNKLIFPCIIFGVIYKLFSSISINLLGSIVLASVVSLILFYLKIWAGGDCKLYLAIILLMPNSIIESTFYGISYIVWIPILAFLIGYFYIIGDSFYQKLKQHKKNNNLHTKAKNDFIRYIKYYVVIIFINYCMNNLFKYLNIQLNTWMYMIISFGLIYMFIKIKILEEKFFILFVIFIDIYIGVINLNLLFNIKQLLIWLAIIISSLLKHFNNDYNYEEIVIEQLKPGMILSTTSSYIFFNDKLSKYKRISDETLRSRLTESDITQIKEVSSKRDYIKTITIMKKIPFALFISLSVIVVILKGVFI